MFISDFFKRTAVAGVVAATMASQSAEAQPGCLPNEINMGPYANCSVPKRNGGTYTEETCKEENKAALKDAREKNPSAQIRTSGNKMYICAIPQLPAITQP